MRLKEKVVLVSMAAAMAVAAPAEAEHHKPSGYTTLSESACRFTAAAQWTGHPTTARVKLLLGANFGGGPVTIAETDTAPTFDADGRGSGTATWTLSPAPDNAAFWSEAWLVDANGDVLEVLRNKSAKPLRARCA
ncbi:MAG: hypothetical protein ABR613_08230 [Actinomycetota bacterium]